MWRSVFLHEFFDQRIDSFQAAPGRATSASLAIAPQHDPASGVTSIVVQPGVGFEYELTTPLQEVVGISCRVRLAYPITAQQWAFSVIRLGDAAELLLKTSNPTADQSGTLVSPGGRIGASFFSFKAAVLPANKFTEVRFDWHSTGQARLLFDDRLVAYRHSTSVGKQLTVDRVSFGIPSGTGPAFRISRVFVRVLPRVDPLRHLSTLLPTLEVPPEDANRCRQIVMANLLALVDRLREFMAQFHQATSQSWSQQQGPASGPFQVEARKAHDLAMKCATALITLLRTSDFSAPESFLDPFTDFLAALHSVLPAEFEALAAELLEATVLPDDCRKALDKTAEQNKDALQAIGELLMAATERIRLVAGGK